LLPERWSRRNPPLTTIGRLDRDTTGVLLLTDLGELVHRWTSPRHKIPKLYEVTVDAPLKEDLIQIFKSGELQLSGEDKPCLPAALEIVDAHHATLELNEGRHHQVKRMFAHHGYQVLRLHRSRFGDFDVSGLNPGQWKVLSLPNDGLQ
jgi:16S rRNA pseudouridine516 synthase